MKVLVVQSQFSLLVYELKVLLQITAKQVFLPTSLLNLIAKCANTFVAAHRRNPFHNYVQKPEL